MPRTRARGATAKRQRGRAVSCRAVGYRSVIGRMVVARTDEKHQPGPRSVIGRMVVARTGRMATETWTHERTAHSRRSCRSCRKGRAQDAGIAQGNLSGEACPAEADTRRCHHRRNRWCNQSSLAVSLSGGADWVSGARTDGRENRIGLSGGTDSRIGGRQSWQSGVGGGIGTRQNTRAPQDGQVLVWVRGFISLSLLVGLTNWRWRGVGHGCLQLPFGFSPSVQLKAHLTGGLSVTSAVACRAVGRGWRKRRRTLGGFGSLGWVGACLLRDSEIQSTDTRTARRTPANPIVPAHDSGNGFGAIRANTHRRCAIPRAPTQTTVIGLETIGHRFPLLGSRQDRRGSLGMPPSHPAPRKPATENKKKRKIQHWTLCFSCPVEWRNGLYPALFVMEHSSLLNTLL